MTPTLESLALARVRETYPDLQRTGFRRAVLKLEPAIQRWEINFIPDGWFKEFLPDVYLDFLPDTESGGTHVFTCVEIEDKHPLSREKMWAYCQLWDALDCYAHYLRLLVFDRYGLNERELNLGKTYCDSIIQMAMEKAGRGKELSQTGMRR